MTVTLTPKQLDQRLRDLYRDRFALIDVELSGTLTPGQRRLKRHLEREIDWYEAKESAPQHEARTRVLREITALGRRVKGLLAKLPADPDAADEGGGT